jgi:hypothetical protein
MTSHTDPATGIRHTWGLGAVGEPILPFTGKRADGFTLVIHSGAAAPAVYLVDTRAEPLKSGKFPSSRVPWSALGAPDFDPFAVTEPQ